MEHQVEMENLAAGMPPTLGWGDRADKGTVQLTVPPDLLRRVFGRLAKGVAGGGRA